MIRKSYSTSTIEYIFAEIGNNEGKILLGCIYRPNRYVPFENILNEMENIGAEYTDIIVAGDLNSNLLKESSLTDACASVGLYSVNTTIPTHFTSTNNTLLDLFLLSDKNKILLYDQLSAPCFSKHDLIFLSYNFKTTPRKKELFYYDFNKIDYTVLSTEFENIDWNLIYNMYSADEQIQFLNNNVNYLFHTTTPVRKIQDRATNPCWFNSFIKVLINIRDQYHARWKTFKTLQLYNEFKNARKAVNDAILANKIKHFGDKFRTAVGSKKMACHQGDWYRKIGS